MKTIKEWLDQLPQPQRHEAINNVINQHGAIALENKVRSLTKAIQWGFDWDRSPEGAQYWYNLYLKIVDDENSKQTT